MLILAVTRERFCCLSMLHLNGIVAQLKFSIMLPVVAKCYSLYPDLLHSYFSLTSKTHIYSCDSGLTNSNYKELTRVYEKYKDKGTFLPTQLGLILSLPDLTSCYLTDYSRPPE